MVGSPDMFVRSGATINLTCVISRSPEPPAFVFWYHNDRMINYDYKSLDRGDITLSKNPAKVDSVISRLLIKAARHNDSGNYTCSPSNAEATSIYVHVLQGEKRQSNRNGIQNDGTSSTENTSSGSAAASNKTPTSTLATLFLFLGLFFPLTAYEHGLYSRAKMMANIQHEEIIMTLFEILGSGTSSSWERQS
ncbi:hypothetical protein HDE_02969 [Halotydeus destructor]|nr:hypothetical protein HDE_02969 [Halotydeus destructor]